MPTSNSSNFADMLRQMLEARKKCGSSESFAAEAGVFMGTFFAFLRGEGAALPEKTIGALMCMQALDELYKLGQWDQVIRYGVPIADALADSVELPTSVKAVVAAAEHSALSQLSNAARHIGRVDEALKFADTACQGAGDDPAIRCMALNNRGLALHDLGRLREAEGCYREGIEVLDRLDLRAIHTSPRLLELRQTLEQNLRSLEEERGQVLEPVPVFFPKSLADRGPISDYPGLFKRETKTESQRLNNEGLRLMQQEQFGAALESFLRAREAGGNLTTEMSGIIECNIAHCYDALNQPREAQLAYERAIAIHESNPANWKQLATDLFNLGGMLQQRGNTDCAAHFKRAWDVIRLNNEHSILAVSVLRHLALCRFTQKDFRRARAAAERGLGIYEKLRPDVAETEDGHSGALERYRSLLELYLYLAVHEGWVEDGKTLIERGKARFWYEALFGLAQHTHFAKPSGDLHELAQAYGGARKGEFVFNFFVGPNATFVFAKLNGSLELYRVDLRETELLNLVEQVRREFQAPGPDDDFSDGAKRLSEKLFRSAVHTMPRAKHIVVMPDGPLWALPFDALPIYLNENNFIPMVDVAPLQVAPSYAVLNDLRKLPCTTEQKVLVISDPAFGADTPRLPGTRTEARYIKEAVGGIHLQGPAATASAFFEHVGSCRLLHLATHAFGELNKSDAFVYFSDGSGEKTVTISAAEILEHNMIASLVFLSTCHSSIAQQSIGEGLTSLGRAFLLAGARSVISSQWPVEDDETAEFVGAFYKHLAKGKSVAVALWNAKHDRRKAGASAQTWAAFQVYGDGDIVPLCDS